MSGIYECNCCGAKVTRDQIAMVVAYGIETAACCTCRGIEPDDEPVADMRVIGSLDGITCKGETP